MAVSFEGTNFPEPTGAVPFDDSPQQYGLPVDQTPTGAVENTGEPVTTEFGPSGLRPTGAVEGPVPQVHRNTSVKVINAPEQPAPKGATTAETTNTGSVRAQRAQHAADDTAADGH